MKLIRAANTNRVLGLRIGSLSVTRGAYGWADYYRKGYVIHLGHRFICHVPTSRYRKAIPGYRRPIDP